MSTPAYDERKFKELVLYLAQRLEGDQTFGAVKLNKLLYFADNIAYCHHGAPITGVEYFKMELGPGPRVMPSVRAHMENGGEIRVERKERAGFSQPQVRIVAQREPDLSVFSGVEVALIDRIVEFTKGATGAVLSEVSHMMMGWRIAKMGESIPYQAFFLSNAPTTERSRQRVRELAEAHGW